MVWADRRFQLGHGRVVALYVMAYTAGRGWIEALRIDDVQMNDVLGLRLNVWTSIVLFVAAAVYFVWSARRHPGRETVVYTDGSGRPRRRRSDDAHDDAADTRRVESDESASRAVPTTRAPGSGQPNPGDGRTTDPRRPGPRGARRAGTTGDRVIA